MGDITEKIDIVINESGGRTVKRSLDDIADSAKTASEKLGSLNTSADSFVKSLKRQADILGFSRSQILAYDAAHLKLTATQKASVDASIKTVEAYEKTNSAASRNVDILGFLRSNIASLIAGYVSLNAVMAGGKAIINTALANERLNNTLIVATGSAEAAARETVFLRKASEELGLQFVTTAGQYAKLAVAAKDTRLEGQATRDIFLAVAKASTVLGMSSSETSGALLAIQQMISKAKVSAEELRGQLGERLTGALQTAARALGVTTAELDKMLEQGQVSAEKMLPAFAEELEKTFGAQAQQAAQGLQSKINRLDNSFSDLKTTIGNTGLIDLLSDGIVLATRFVDALSGAKVLSAVDAQKQKIIEMREELESLGNRKHIPLIGDLLFDKKQADLLSQRIDDGIQDLKKLEQAALTSAEALSGKKAITPGTKPELPKEWADAAEKAAKARKKEIEDYEKTIAALKRETAEIGLNAIQRKMLAASIEAAKAPNDELRKQIMAEAGAYAQLSMQQEQVVANKKFIEEQSKALINLGNNQTKQLSQQLEDQRAQNALIGKTREEIIAVAGAKERETAAVIRNAAVYAGDMHDAYISYANDLEATGRLQQQLMQEQQVQRYAQQWNQTWSSIEQTGKTAFVQFAAHGVGAMESIGQAIKTSLFDLLYQLTFRKWMINIGASLEGVFSGTAGATGGSSTVGMLASLASMFSGVRVGGVNTSTSAGVFGGGSSAGTAFIGGPGTAIGGTTSGRSGFGMNTGSLMALGSAAGPYGMAAAAAFMVLSALEKKVGDYKLSGGAKFALGAYETFSPMAYAVKGLGLQTPEALIGKFLFGRGPYKFRQQSIQGDITSGGLDGTITDVYRSKGAVFTGNRHKSFESDIPSEIIRDIDKSIKSIYKSSHEFAENLGLDASLVDRYTQEIQIKSEKGKTLTTEAVGEMLTGISDEIAKSVMPNIDDFKLTGETAGKAFARLNNELDALKGGVENLGGSVAYATQIINGMSIDARSSLIDQAGGIDRLGELTSAFFDGFLTDAEKLTVRTDQLNSSLTKLGLSTDITQDQYKALVQSPDTSNTLRIALLELAKPFLEVRNAQEQQLLPGQLQQAQVQQQRLGLETQLLQLQGNTVELRRRELEALDPANRALQENIYALIDQKAATDALKNNLSGAFSDLQKSVEADRKRITDQFNIDLAKVNSRIQGVNDSISKLTSLSEVLKSTTDTINPQSLSNARDQIRAAITSVAAGNSPDTESIKQSLDTLSRQDSSSFSTLAEFQRSQAQSVDLIDKLKTVTGSQLTLEERSLAALEANRDILQTSFDNEIARLDSILTQGQEQVDALNGISTSVLSLADALSNFNAASVAAGGQTIGVTSSGISFKDIRDYSASHTPDEIYAAARKYGVTQADIVASGAFTDSQVTQYLMSKGLASFDVGGYVPKTGLALIHKNEQVLTSGQQDAITSEIKQLREDLSAALAIIAGNTATTAKILDEVSAGGNAFLTESLEAA